MKLRMPSCAAAAVLLLAGAPAHAGTGDAETAAAVRQIAIIGAGAGGASTAYHLRQFADEDGVAVNVTVFEQTDRVGGRTRTVAAFGDAAQPVELGASIFIEANEILWTAAARFGLPLQSPDEVGGGDGGGGGGDDAGDGGDADPLLGVWDGDGFVYTQDSRGGWARGWWNLARLVWKYGAAPYRADKLMQATVARFRALYRAPHFPFRSLTARASELELTFVTSQTGAQLLAANRVGAAFAHDIVQAATRVNYAANLARIHGLDTMVCLAATGASQVRGGNWQIFDRMVRASGAHLRANTSVAGLARAAAPGGGAPQYVVRTKEAAGEAAAAEEDDSGVVFDHVVLAAPLQFSHLAVGDDVLQTAIDAIPYVQLHVTLLTSPLRFSAAFFKLPPGAAVPTTVLTTLGAGDDAGSGAQGAGKAGFFSISTLRRVVNPATQRQEYLYKIFSPEKVTAAFLSDLFGVDVPESALAAGGGGGTAAGGSTAEAAQEAISWFYPHVFHSYPQALPRVTFQDPVVGDRVYYTSGIESFISTMETSALAGKNVARLIVDDILGLDTGGPAAGEPKGPAAEETVVGEL